MSEHLETETKTSRHRRTVLFGSLLGWTGLSLIGVYLATYGLDALKLVDGILRYPFPIGIILTALGWVLVSGATMSPRHVWQETRFHPAAPLAGIALGAVVGAVLLVIKTASAQPDSTTRLAGFVSLTVAMVIAAVLATRAFSLSGVHHCDRSDTTGPKALVTLGLAVAISVQMVAIVMKVEIYPFAPFRMYSALYLDPREVTFGRIDATDATGRSLALHSGVGSATLRRWLREEDPRRLRRLVGDLVVRHENRQGTRIVSYAVIEETWRVVPYPAEPGVELADERVILEVDRP